jgi:hypothetical protein
MATSRLGTVLRHLRGALERGDGESADGQLLERFLARRDEAAFEALVRRHGPMVLAACRRLLGNDHDAEDAFQATFLVLARRAAAGRCHPPRGLGGLRRAGFLCGGSSSRPGGWSPVALPAFRGRPGFASAWGPGSSRKAWQDTPRALHSATTLDQPGSRTPCSH